jgi:hypothetical protein
MYAFENQIIEVPIGNEIFKVKLVADKYHTGNLAIMGVCEDGEPFATLTVNMPQHQHLLEKDEVFIKNWSENEAFAQEALMSGFFCQWSKTVPSGFVQVPIWKVF